MQPSCLTNHQWSIKKPILLFLILVSFPLNSLMVLEATQSSVSMFHLSITRSEKKYFLKSVVQRCFISLTLWPLVDKFRLLSNNESKLGRDFPLSIFTAQCRAGFKGGRGPGPQAPHQQRAPHQTLHIIFSVDCNLFTLILILKYYTEYLSTNAYLSDKLFCRDFWRPKMSKILILRGSAPDPTGGAYWESLHCSPRSPRGDSLRRCPITPLPFSAFR